MPCIPLFFIIMSAQPNIRRRIVAALAVRRDREAARELLDYMSERDRGSCEELISRFESEPDKDLVLEQLIRQLVASEKFSSLAEVHPAWVLEFLRGEPPRVVGLILRSLPSNHVRFLLEHLPPILRERIPNMVESFAVDPQILAVIRRRFEKNFLPMRISRQVRSPAFEHLYFLKGDELAELIRELGLLELAIAFAGMSKKALHMIYNRLDLKDARRLKNRIDELKVMSISTELYRQARFNLLEIEGRHEGSERMLKSVGLAALASAAGHEYDNMIRLLMQKLPPTDGYLLKRFIDERRKRTSEVVAGQRQDLVLAIISELAAGGRISRQWMSFSPDEESPDDLTDRSETEEDSFEDTAAIKIEEQ